MYDPYVRYSFFPQANEAMFAVMLLLTHNPAASAALEFSVLALGALTVPLWFLGSGRRVGAGLVAGTGRAGQPGRDLRRGPPPLSTRGRSCSSWR